MSVNIENKVAFVTGALGGIGKEVVKVLLDNKAKGVALVDFSEAAATKFQQELEQTYGPGKTIFIRTDVCSKDQLKDAFDKTIAKFAQLDIVVNGAGIIDEENYERCINVNVIGLMHGVNLAMQHYLPKYKGGKNAYIVNVSSILGVTPVWKLAAYSCTKYAVTSLSMTYGSPQYFEKYGVTVLTICPGFTDTPMIPTAKVSNTPKLAELGERTMQSPRCVANALVHAVNHGANGSVWLTQNGQPAEEIDINDVLKPLQQKTGVC